MLYSKNLLILIGKNVIISLIAITISVVSIFFLNNQIEKITNTIMFNRKLETELKKRTELISTINKGAEIIGNNNNLINNAFIPSNNISPFINKLDDLAAVNSIVQIYHFDTPISSTIESPYPLSTVSFTNNLTINITNLSVYLKNFENLPYFTQIESLNISSQDKLGWIGTSNVSFNAKLYTKNSQ